MTLYPPDSPSGAVRARWMFRGRLTAASALALGGGEDGRSDIPVLRSETLNGRIGPLLLGEGIAGALRGHLLDRLVGYGIEETACPKDIVERVERAFGARFGTDEPARSKVIPLHARGRLPDDSDDAEIRSGIAIDAATGLAREHLLHDREVWPRCTTFDAGLDVVVPLGMTLEAETGLLQDVLLAVSGLEDGSVRLGARRNRGLGEVIPSAWRAHRYDLTTEEGLRSWQLRPAEDWMGGETFDTILGAANRVAPQVFARKLEVEAVDARRRLRIDVTLTFAGLFLSRERLPTGRVDARSRHSGGKSVLTGAELGGRLRSHLLRVAGAVGMSDPEWCANGIFGGPVGDVDDDADAPQDTVPGASRGPSPSRLRIDERSIDTEHEPALHRVRIDRVLGGVLPGGLFGEQPLNGGVVERLSLELRDPTPDDARLLILAVTDVVDDLVPLAGGAAVGYGRLAAHRSAAIVHLPDGTLVEIDGIPREQWNDADVRRDRAQQLATIHAGVSG